MSNKFDETYNPDRDFLPGESEEKSLHSIQSRIDELSNDSGPPLLKSSKSFPWLFLVLGLVIMGAIFIFWNNQSKTKDLPMAYFEVYPNYQQVATRGPEIQAELKLIYEAYDVGDFNKAIDLFLQSANKLSAEDRFYQAVAMEAGGNWRGAKSILTEIQPQLRSAYIPASQWYLALAHLEAKEYTLALKLLRQIELGDSIFREKAKQLIREIDAD